MSNMRCDTISIGSIIQYVLRTSQQPVNPNRLWRGRVEMVIRNAYNVTFQGSNAHSACNMFVQQYPQNYYLLTGVELRLLSPAAK